MYGNIVLPVQNLRKTDKIKPSGLCRIVFFIINDVLAWPDKHPGDGVIYDPVQLKEGSSFYSFQPADKERFFTEAKKNSSAGPYIEALVNGRLGGDTLNIITSLDAMKHHEFGLIICNRNGEKRLIGDEDSGAEIDFEYTSGDQGTSRLNNIRFTWESQNRMPIYIADTIMVDDEVIPIGGNANQVVTNGSALNELIPVAAVATYVLQWTPERKAKFGNAAVIQVYIIDEDGKLRQTNVEIVPDSFSAPTKYTIDFGGDNTTALIVIS